METKNKSLSARIKRRNKAGFKGIGSYNFEKKTSYGDYREEFDNHKDKDKNIYQENLINHAKLCGVRHPGSKTLKQLSLYK